MFESRDKAAGEGRTSMLLCTRAVFLTSKQMEILCRAQRTMLAPVASKFAPASTFDRLFTYIDSPGECSTREALTLLRLLPRKA